MKIVLYFVVIKLQIQIQISMFASVFSEVKLRAGCKVSVMTHIKEIQRSL